MSAVVPPGLPGSLWVVSASCPTTEFPYDLSCLPEVVSQSVPHSKHTLRPDSTPPLRGISLRTPWGRDSLNISEAVNTPEKPPAPTHVVWGRGAASLGTSPPGGLMGLPEPPFPFPFPFTSGRASANLSPCFGTKRAAHIARQATGSGRGGQTSNQQQRQSNRSHDETRQRTNWLRNTMSFAA